MTEGSRAAKSRVHGEPGGAKEGAIVAMREAVQTTCAKAQAAGGGRGEGSGRSSERAAIQGSASRATTVEGREAGSGKAPKPNDDEEKQPYTWAGGGVRGPERTLLGWDEG